MKDALGNVQSILVLGGASDLALATCRELVGRRGATVVLAARKPEACADAVDVLRRAGASAVDAVAFDALDFPSHDAFIGRTFDKYGGFDVVLVAFGVLGDQLRAEADRGAALEIVQTNFDGVVSVSVPLVTRLRAQGHGCLVLFSSVAGERVRRSNFVYGSAKAGADAYFQGLSAALAGSGVAVTIVRPGFVHTKMTAGMRAAPLATTPEQVGRAVAGAIARGTEIVWVPVSLRFVMAVLRHLPRRVFRRLPL